MVQYNKDYFDWQKNIGAFGGVANLFKFDPYIKSEDTVLDFGCGGGFLLHNLQVRAKAGVEINPEARKAAVEQEIKVYPSIDEVPDDFATVVISNHALEHVYCPYDTLKALLPKIKDGGQIVFVVPHQKPDEAYIEDDVNQHLYTWNPLTLGNLAKAAGYVNIQADVIQHAWPPKYQQLYQKHGQKKFDRICKKHARKKKIYQVRVVASKPS